MRSRIAAVVAGLLCAGLIAPHPADAHVAPADPAPPPAGVGSSHQRVGDPDHTLGTGWRTSSDRAVTTTGDETGLHLLVADAAQAYAWRTVATLSEPGVDADLWIGQSCVTASGRRAVVVYAPHRVSNSEQGMYRGALAAVVDLESGAVTKLPQLVTLAYFNPGCGADETAVLSRLETTDRGATVTRLFRVDTAKGVITGSFAASGQLTSPVPTGSAITAARGRSLVKVSGTGSVTVSAVTTSIPFRLVPLASGAVAYQETGPGSVTFSQVRNGKTQLVATAPAGAARLRRGGGGRAYLVGSSPIGKNLPSGWAGLRGPADAEVSTGGRLLITDAGADAATGKPVVGGPADGLPDRIRIGGFVPATGTKVAFDFVPSARPAATTSPALTGSARHAPAPTLGLATDPYATPIDLDRTCAFPRNDARQQTYQPTADQVEWAADLAVQRKLTFQRPANWNNDTLPAYVPQVLFTPASLAGGGQMPAQVLLGVLAQESNLWQASWHVVDGSAGNVLTADFYGEGVTRDPHDISWSDSDCGYGAGQITTGMRRVDTGVILSDLQQRAVALDYVANIAAAYQILVAKWNQTRAAGLIANNGDPAKIENWWFALWAYNTGYHTPDEHGYYGVGWLNNPANPIYPADRKPFLWGRLGNDVSAWDNAKHPSDWSYPERVLGYASRSVVRYDYVSETYKPTFQYGTWVDFPAAQPLRSTFCVAAVNQCDLSAPAHQPGNYPGEPAGPCQNDELMACYWHSPVTWTNCATMCGTGSLRFTSVDPRPYATSVSNPHCDLSGTQVSGDLAALPAGALIVDDLPDASVGPNGCAGHFTNRGTFTLAFASEIGRHGYEIFPSKADFHQIGSGFGGHFWFAHNVQAGGPDGGRMVTGIWRLNQELHGWGRVLVHMPDYGANSVQASYQVDLGGGSKVRTAVQRTQENRWVSLGAFQFNGTPQVSLTNVTHELDGSQDVAWDAVAFLPLPGKPTSQIVAMGDSYSAGEGAGGYYAEADNGGDSGKPYEDLCHRSRNAWSRKMVRADRSSLSVGARADSWDSTMDYHLIACSGAQTENILPYYTDATHPANAFGERGSSPWAGDELSQLDRGYLDENTTLVTLSIGGNDARFSPIIQQCIYGDLGQPCDDTGLEGETEVLRTTEPRMIHDQVRPSVATVLRLIHEAAPNARIVLMGYPVLITSPNCFNVAGLTDHEVAWLADIARVLRDEFAGAVADANVMIGSNKVVLADSMAAFAGKGACGDPQDIWGINFDKTPGESSSLGASQQSFHPNDAGTTIYGQVMTAALRSIGM